MAQCPRDLIHNEVEETLNETGTAAKTLIFNQRENLSPTSSSYQLSSKHPHTSAVALQHCSSEVQQSKVHQSVRQSSFQCAHLSWTSQGQQSLCESDAEAKWDIMGNTLKLAITDFAMAIVSQSTVMRKQSNCEHCSKTGKTNVITREHEEEQKAICSNQVLSDNGILEIEDIMPAKPENQDVSMEPLSIEPSIPLIQKRGYLNGPQCERLMKRLEILQDGGHFQAHKRLVKVLLKHCMEHKSSHVRQKEYTRDTKCEQLLKKLEFQQNDRKSEETDFLFSLYSRLCGEKEYADLELSLVIEQGVSFMYHKKFKK
ncbi:hypothetical protein AWC38_SpisGene25119, partial [Stylophora pistillata]